MPANRESERKDLIMKRTSTRVFLFLSLTLLVFHQSSLAIDPEQKISAQLKSKTLRLKTHEDAFGKPRNSRWNNRKIYTAEITMLDSTGDHLSARSGSSNARGAYLLCFLVNCQCPQVVLQMSDYSLINSLS